MQTKPMRLYYLLWTLLLFGTEIYIGACTKGWIRGSLGDILVIPLLYCILRIFTAKLPVLLPFLTCCIGFIAEVSQYFKLYQLLGLEKDSLGAIILGTGFSWSDMLCYMAGMGLIYLIMAVRVLLTSRKKGVTE